MDNLLPLKTRLKKFQSKTGMQWEVLEKDYFLSWILHALAQDDSLGIVFKGGTALKKCYFGDYRFSEDLDFTALAHAPKSFDDAMNRLASTLQVQINKVEPFKIVCQKYREKNPHPEGQEAYLFKGMFEWHRASFVKVFIEISRSETLCFSPVLRSINHEYGETFSTPVLTYCLEEIVLEKLRGILQHTKKIHEKDWSRSRARDYYDLWRILSTYEIRTDKLVKSLMEKCVLKGVSFSNSSSFFDEAMIKFIKQTWQSWLGPLVKNLPECDLVLNDLRSLISKLIDKDRV